MKSGYSTTPLAKKLGLKADFKIYLYQAPDHYVDLFDKLPDSLEYTKTLDVVKLDFIHAFFTSKEALKMMIQKLKNGLKQNGILWVSWPKGASKIETDVNREIVRSAVLETGLVDVKVAAIDEDWSGLKFMYRLKDRN
ncbi:DUF3052 domain-containing protein [uncultured Winogradskyella sp.]|uniref:DUF3052 domain-containing protein n=1 Tax=uncultured Winogradskyella sp. TaxID=395353 RepID=UPI0026136653|nr:DUF3052 domain-containing protein [uncultured Winogradskyella sp.]